VRDVMLPDVTKRLENKTGYKSYFYGTISRDQKRWETVPATPRYSTHYVGLRNRIGILSESYSYAPFKDRVLASRAFVQSILEYSAEHKEAIQRLLTEAREVTIRAGQEPKETDRIVLRQAIPIPRAGLNPRAPPSLLGTSLPSFVVGGGDELRVLLGAPLEGQKIIIAASAARKAPAQRRTRRVHGAAAFFRVKEAAHAAEDMVLLAAH